jgi:membrane-associated phospholipid phosphatase
VLLPANTGAPIDGRLASHGLDLAGSYQRGSDAWVRVAPSSTLAVAPQALVSRDLPLAGAYARGSSEHAIVPPLPRAGSPVPTLPGRALTLYDDNKNTGTGYQTYPTYRLGSESGKPAPGTASVAAARADSHGYREGFYLADEGYLLSWPENAWRLVSAPTRFERDDWITTALVVGGTAALFLFDEPINDFWQDSIRGKGSDDIADFLTPLGDTDKLLLGSLGIYSLAEVLDARREKAAALMTFESVTFAALATGGLKLLIGRTRPDEASSAFDYGGIGSDINSSLPSGHAATTMAAATVVSEVYGETNPWVPWVAYPTAGLVALSRLNDERHWASDLFLGAAVGHFIGRMVVAHNPFLANEQLSLSPSVSPEFQGVNLTLAL